MSRALICLAACLLPALAFAQTEAGSQPIRTRFIDMGEMQLTGHRALPDAFMHTARGRAQFESLVRLKKDVLPLLVQTGSSPALR